ncbi:MAG: hypothetical protein WCR79_07185, partial [Fusobacterium sp.]
DLKDLPTKDRRFKDGKTLFQSTPIRFGKGEITNLLLGSNVKDIKEILNSYANNTTDRNNLLINQLTGDPFDPEVELSGTQSNNAKLIKALLNSMGIDLEYDEEKDELVEKKE